MAAEFTAETFESQVLGASQVAMVDFWSEGWPPCKRLGPVIDELASENESAIVGKVDVGDNMELAVKYGISAVPTILVFKGGEVVERIQGFKEKDALQALIDSHSAV